MYHYELSKYNPLYRIYKNGNRYYSRPDWTGISDIGKTFNNSTLSVSDYLKIETAYVDAVGTIMEYKKIDTLIWKGENFSKWQSSNDIKNRISDALYSKLYTDEIFSIYDSLENGVVLNKNAIDKAVRLLLREEIGGILIFPRKLKVFVGYDYLMGVDSSSVLTPIQDEIEKLGLFLD